MVNSTAPVQDDEWTPRAMLLRRRADAESQGGSCEIDIGEIDALLSRLSPTPDTGLIEALDNAKVQAKVAVAIRDALADQDAELSPPQTLYVALKAMEAVSAALANAAPAQVGSDDAAEQSPAHRRLMAELIAAMAAGARKPLHEIKVTVIAADLDTELGALRALRKQS